MCTVLTLSCSARGVLDGEHSLVHVHPMAALARLVRVAEAVVDHAVLALHPNTDPDMVLEDVTEL